MHQAPELCRPGPVVDRGHCERGSPLVSAHTASNARCGDRAVGSCSNLETCSGKG